MMIFFRKKDENVWKLRKKSYLCIAFEKESTSERSFGEVAEWSIAAVLKTVVLRGTGGSNPSLSAIKGVNQAFVRFTPFIFLYPKSTKGCSLDQRILGPADFPGWYQYFMHIA